MQVVARNMVTWFSARRGTLDGIRQTGRHWRNTDERVEECGGLGEGNPERVTAVIVSSVFHHVSL